MANKNPWQGRAKSVEATQKLLRHPETGEVGNISWWARRLGLTHSGMRYRLERFSLAEALTAPVRSNARSA
jgi:hypothetical protein